MAEDVRELLATACRILAAEGHEHFQFGHASSREMAGTERFWVKPANLGLREVRPDDLVLVDLEGNRLAGDGPLHTELPIHSEIYRRRPDVRAVVHTHPFHAAALAATSTPFRVVSQDSVPFAAGPARFDSALLIVTPEHGRAVAEALADGSVVLLRNHGIVVAGRSVEEATWLAVAFERSVRLQHAAAVLGEVREIDPGEIEELGRQLGIGRENRAKVIFAYLHRALGPRGQD
ncbi:MAG TPA: class II aldolase/adducin family protein [Candidatus Limnocylindrales bacterium]|nr:class II aldolase/adducin family protein [Candidatus Limnocylindrales bacterium]